MNGFMLLLLTEVDHDEEESASELELAVAAISCLAVGAEQARIARAERRAETRQYLQRDDLLPNPREATSWQKLFSSRRDRSFITTMGVNVGTFEAILAAGFAKGWNENTIPRADIQTTGAPRLDRRSLDAAGALGLVLHYLSSTAQLWTLQEVFALTPTTCSRYLTFSLATLLDTLKKMPVLRSSGQRLIQPTSLKSTTS